MVGAGPTGVEVVGQIAELAHRVLPGDYREIDTRKARMVLVEAASAVLGPFDEKLQRYTQAGSNGWASSPLRHSGDRDGRRQHHGPRQRRRGAHSGPDEGMGCRGESITAGRSARPSHGRCDGPGGANRGGTRLHPARPSGGVRDRDMVSLNGLPGVAQPAIQEGKYVGKVIRARLDGDTGAAPFRSTSTRAAWRRSAACGLWRPRAR